MEDLSFSIHYQPIVDLKNGRLKAVEALLRPLGNVDLCDVIEFIENGDSRLGAIITLAAIDQARVWAGQGFNIPMHVNVSPAQLTSQFVELLRVPLEEIGPAISFEVTERQVLTTGQLRVLNDLRLFGATVALDDFGAGARSFADMLDLGARDVKIDQRFIRGLGVSRKATAIVHYLIGMCSALGVNTIAEGVETNLQRTMLIEMGCNSGQGWLWYPALPPERLQILMRTTLPAA